MSGNYASDMMNVAVAKMLKSLGWNSTHPTALNVLTDVAIKYTKQITTLTCKYANEFGCADPNLDHLGLAFQDNQLNLSELREYVSKVNWNLPPTPVPKFPIPKKDNLNFLKPGSREVVTRPVHIHEHLPPMYEFNETSENETNISESRMEGFERSVEVYSDQSCKKKILVAEEKGTPTRELSSVMMTKSGFISPVREGKLPDSRTPPEKVLEKIPVKYFNADINSEKVLKKKEKKKEKFCKELFKSLREDIPKNVTMKDEAKSIQRKTVNIIEGSIASSNNKFVLNKEVKVAPKILSKLIAAKTIKSNTQTIEKPAPFKNVDKLFAEPNIKKMNIFKKITTYSSPGLNEMIAQNTPIVVNKEKRKRKDKSKIKKVQKISSPFSDLRFIDTKSTKTSETLLKPPAPLPMIPQFNLFPQFAGPSLIPAPLTNPLNLLYNSKNYSGQPNQLLPPYNPYVPPRLKINVPKVKPDNTSTKLTCRTPSPLTSSNSEPIDPLLLSLKLHRKIKELKKDKLKKKLKKEKKLKEEKKHKLKKERKEKRNENKVQPQPPRSSVITKQKLWTPSSRPDDSNKNDTKTLINEEKEKKSETIKTETFPELAKISALVIGQPKPKPIPPVKDSEGNVIWICPACGEQDDGSPMIACDGCDAWYHWICVGVQDPPHDNEDWYCRLCMIQSIAIR